MSERTGSRGERRKRETRRRLVDAALQTFLRRGFDAATTAEIAEAADLGAGTYYLYFRDKRDIFEALARRATRHMVERWREHLGPDTPLPKLAARGLEAAAAYWEEDRDRARLLLEGGPSLGSQGHLRLLEEIASRVRDSHPPRPGDPSPEVIATVLVGLAIELGRVVVGSDDPEATRATIDGTIALAERTLRAAAQAA